MYVVTVALNELGSVVVLRTMSDKLHCVNRQGTTALGSIESDEPSLAAVTTPSQIQVSLKSNTESCVILGFSELTILQQQISTGGTIILTENVIIRSPLFVPYIPFE